MYIGTMVSAMSLAWTLLPWLVFDAAIAAELMDRREVQYWTPDVDAMRMICERAAELRHAPPLAATAVLPSRETVRDMLRFAHAYRDWLASAYALTGRPVVYEALRETEHLIAIWDVVHDAQCEYHYVHVRRRALLRLAEELGVDAVMRGWLPDHVPLWHFHYVHP